MSSVQHSPVILAVEVPTLFSGASLQLSVLIPIRLVTFTVQEYVLDSREVVCVSITRVMSGYELLIKIIV